MAETYHNWFDRGKALVQNHRQAKWLLGDWLLDAEYDENVDTAAKAFGKEYPNWIRKAAKSFSYQYDTFLEFRRVAKIFPEPTRVGALSWNHHRVVAAVEDTDQRDKWLQQALKRGWCVSELRTRIADKSQTPSEPSHYDFSKKERKLIASLARQTNLSQRHVTRLIVRYFLMHGDLKGFVGLNKKPSQRESYLTELRAKNGRKLRRWRFAGIAA